MGIYEPYVKVEDGKGKGELKARPEQTDAIGLAFRHFKKNGGKSMACAEFLWNAKMRFGKTVSALWLIEKMKNELGKTKTLIVTHRPVVNASWHGDYRKVFKANLDEYCYGTSKETGDDSKLPGFEEVKKAAADGKCVLFFASLQYLRSKKGELERKREILEYGWDLVIVDEAHEGTQTEIGGEVFAALKKAGTCVLNLSGTPFNLLDKFKGEQIYSWDYIAEQKRKREWEDEHPLLTRGADEVNPYRELPEMRILTFRLGEMTDDRAIIDAATGEFSFAEFFRVKKGLDVPKEERGKFVHEAQVLAFLRKLCETSGDSHYPFSRDEYRDAFRHTLWVVPGVEQAKALKTLIEEKTSLCKMGFKVVNVAGSGVEDEGKDDALNAVLEAMRVNPAKGTDDSDQTRTITLSCGRLTSGVTVAPWTAVLYMKGSDTTSAQTYMQTIFRVQSPHVHKGMMKSACYVFDFAPERALTMMAETAKFSRAFERKTGRKKGALVATLDDREKMSELLKYCPVIECKNGKPPIANGKMVSIDCNRLFSKLNEAYTERVVTNGFDHPCLYNNEMLEEVNGNDDEVLKYVADLFDKDGNPKGGANPKILVNTNGKLTPKQRAELEAIRKKRKEEAEMARKEAERKYKEKLAKMSPQEREKFLKEEAEKAIRKQLREDGRKSLKGLSTRIPLMMYGANIEDFKDDDVTVERFTDKKFIDDESWNEFMPKGVTRELFKKLAKFYNADVFRDAGVRIRRLAREADGMKTEERIGRIAQIFKWFKNPDKETVLTPWEVVNRHLSGTIGGWCFFDDDFKTPCTIEDPKTGARVPSGEPRWVERGEATAAAFGEVDEQAGKIKTRVLEINSKTGLYPLYLAYSLYRKLRPTYAATRGGEPDNPEEYSPEDEHAIWDEVVKNNLYVICNTKMAERITRRTLTGFRKGEDGKEIPLHVRQDNLIERASKDKDALIADLQSEGYWEMGKNANDSKKNGKEDKPKKPAANSKKAESKKIEFNAVVGNPPYQLEGASTRKAPIYHIFYDLAFELSDKVSFITPGRFLYKAGQTPKEWMDRVLSDEHFKVVEYFQNSTDVFPAVDIKGGVAITYRDLKKKFGKIGFFSKYGELISIQKKVVQKSFVNICPLISSRGMYRFTEKLLEEFPQAKDIQGEGSGLQITPNSFESMPFVFKESGDKNDSYQFYGRVKKERCYQWIKKEYVQMNEYLPKYNVFVPEANGCGAIGEVLSTPIIGTPIIGTPMIGHSDTFLSIGMFETKHEAEACLKYVKTKFARTMLGTLKATQHNPRDTWANVPLQDFTKDSDIDWSGSVAEVDRQLYKKYKLTEKEIAFIEEKVKPMV